MVKRLKSCFETLENPALSGSNSTWHDSAREATVRSSSLPPSHPPPFILDYHHHPLSSFCHPKPPMHRVSSDLLPGSDILPFSLSLSLSPSVILSLFSSLIHPCTTILWVSSKFRLLLSVPFSSLFSSFLANC